RENPLIIHRHSFGRPRADTHAVFRALTHRLSRASGVGLKSFVIRYHHSSNEVFVAGKTRNIQLTPPTTSAAFPPTIIRFSASPMPGHRLTKPTGSASPTG